MLKSSASLTDGCLPTHSEPLNVTVKEADAWCLCSHLVAVSLTIRLTEVPDQSRGLPSFRLLGKYMINILIDTATAEVFY